MKKKPLSISAVIEKELLLNAFLASENEALESKGFRLQGQGSIRRRAG
ncbi:MAG: hypothetical protein LBD81_03070 [Holosporaceae bacterium]|jgi:hypothetical protein|nr:hypothetical protein [Holosporaceae bacterium]